MNNKQMQVGINRRLQLEWLEQAAILYLQHQSETAVREALRAYLQDRMPSGKRGTRGTRSLEQTVTILMRIWVTVPASAKAFRDDGLALLQQLPAREQLPLQWGAVMAAYPFFARVADATGRLLSLQGEAALPQIERRVYEQLGQRSTVTYATRRIVRDYVDWGVLQDGQVKGVYHSGEGTQINDRGLATWLVEALLRANGSEIRPLSSLLQSSALFPFHLPALAPTDLDRNRRLDSFRQGLDQEMVMLAIDGSRSERPSHA
ncbi:MAG: hypothetical protein M3220_10255 [Chloroflexota bacterium]|nr:hypothetical protein [Chloroflexota bacterium]